MFSVVVVAADAAVPLSPSPEAVVRTLAALVPAVVAGVARDFTLAGLSGAPGLAEIADHAGCALALAERPEGVLAAGLAAARGEWLLALRAGFAPGPGFVDEAGDLLGGAFSGVGLLRAEAETLVTRLAPDLATVHGVIVARSRMASGARDIAGLARGVKPARTLRSRLRRVD
jgi:hypothetical protein